MVDKRDYTGDVSDPVDAAGSDRVLRGGSFNAYPYSLRSAFRSGISPTYDGTSLGFRLARSE